MHFQSFQMLKRELINQDMNTNIVLHHVLAILDDASTVLAFNFFVCYEIIKEKIIHS